VDRLLVAGRDAADAVARLKEKSDGDLTILGSGAPIASLVQRNEGGSSLARV
jgi:hypothetical protein